MRKVLVWDFPTRLGHWLLAATFALSFVSGDSEAWRLVHVTAGFAFLGVIVFRVFWGLAGTRYARFSSFLFSPRQVFSYLGGLLKGKPEHWAGHNPAGSYAIYALLLLGMAATLSGWAAYADLNGEWIEELHEAAAYGMLGMVGFHVAGVMASSMVHRENLVKSMITGYKLGKSGEGIPSSRKYWAALLLGSVFSASLLAFVN